MADNGIENPDFTGNGFEKANPSESSRSEYLGQKNIEAQADPERVAVYSFFREKIGLGKEAVIYQPFISRDISPTAAFPESRVIYVDKYTSDVEAYRRKGVEVHQHATPDFDPGPVNVVILDPTLPYDWFDKQLVPGGYLLCSDKYNTATILREDEATFKPQGRPYYELQAVMRPTTEGQSGLVYDTENLEDYWKTIETDEEWQKARLDEERVSYEEAKQLVKELTGKEGEVNV